MSLVYEEWGQDPERAKLERRWHNRVRLDSGTELFNVHLPEQCALEHCAIHNPSDHRMKDWPTAWYVDADGPGTLLRQDPRTKVFYQDPDDAAYEAYVKQPFP